LYPSTKGIHIWHTSTVHLQVTHQVHKLCICNFSCLALLSDLLFQLSLSSRDDFQISFAPPLQLHFHVSQRGLELLAGGIQGGLKLLPQGRVGSLSCASLLCAQGAQGLLYQGEVGLQSLLDSRLLLLHSCVYLSKSSMVVSLLILYSFELLQHSLHGRHASQALVVYLRQKLRADLNEASFMSNFGFRSLVLQSLQVATRSCRGSLGCSQVFPQCGELCAVDVSC